MEKLTRLEKIFVIEVGFQTRLRSYKEKGAENSRQGDQERSLWQMSCWMHGTKKRSEQTDGRG